MNINATLIGQSIAFFVFVWFVMKYVWPPLMAALEERKKTIADGLAAAEHGKHEQELTEKAAEKHIKEAKDQATEIVTQAQKRASEIVEEGVPEEVADAESGSFFDDFSTTQIVVTGVAVGLGLSVISNSGGSSDGAVSGQ